MPFDFGDSSAPVSKPRKIEPNTAQKKGFDFNDEPVKSSAQISRPPLASAVAPNKLVGATPLGGWQQLGAEVLAGAEMGAEGRFMPGLVGKAIPPLLRAAQAGVREANKYPEHKAEHWGDIAKASVEGAFDPQETLTAAALQAAGHPLDQAAGAADIAATIGGGLAGANIGPGMLAKTVLQAPAAALATGAGAAIQHGGEALIDKFVSDPQNNAALKAALGLGAAGGGGVVAHGISKVGGSAYNYIPDKIKKIVGDETMPSSSQVAHADELTTQIDKPESKYLVSDEAAAHTPMDLTPEALNNSEGRARHLIATRNQTDNLVTNADAMRDLAYDKTKKMVGKDLIDIPTDKIQEHFNINDFKKGTHELDKKMKEAEAAFDTDKITALQSLKQVYDFTHNNMIKPALTPNEVGGKVKFNYQDYDKYIQQINALKRSLNTKGMPTDVVRQLNNAIPLVKNAFKTHLKEKEFNGTPEEQERYKGATEFHPRKETLAGQINKVENEIPFLEAIKTTKPADQLRKAKEMEDAEAHFTSGHPVAGVEHITRAMQDLLPHMPEGASYVEKNLQEVPELFKKSLELAQKSNKGMEFLDAYNLKKGHFQNDRKLDSPDIMSTTKQGTQKLIEALGETKANITKRDKELVTPDGLGSLAKMLLTRGFTGKIARMAHLGAKTDVTPMREAALANIDQNMGSALGRQKLRTDVEDAQKIKDLQSKYSKSNLKSAIGAGLISDSMRNASPTRQTPNSPAEDEKAYKARMQRQADEMALVKLKGRAWQR